MHKNNPDFYSFIWLVHKTQSHVIHGPDPSPNKSNGKTPADSVVLDRPCSSKRINFKGPSLIHSLFLLPQIILLKIMGLLLRIKHAGLSKNSNQLKNIWGSSSSTAQVHFTKHPLILVNQMTAPEKNKQTKKKKIKAKWLKMPLEAGRRNLSPSFKTRTIKWWGAENVATHTHTPSYTHTYTEAVHQKWIRERKMNLNPLSPVLYKGCHSVNGDCSNYCDNSALRSNNFCVLDRFLCEFEILGLRTTLV